MVHPLRQFRTDLGLTLRALASETGASKSTLWRVENRKQDPDMELLRQLTALARRRNKSIRVDDFLLTPPEREAAE